MKKQLLLLSLFMFFHCPIFAQDYDQELQEIRQENDPISRANALMDFANSIPLDDSHSIFTYYHEALDIAKTEKDSILLAKLYANISRFHYFKYRFREAEQQLIMAEDILRSMSDHKADRLRINIMFNRAGILGAQGEIEKQQNVYLELIPILEELQDKESLSNAFHGLGIIFFNKGQLNTAKQYFEKSLDYYDNQDPNSINVGLQALSMAMVSLAMDSLQLGEEYLKLAKERVFKSKDTTLQWTNFHYLTGEWSRKKGQNEKAINHYLKALKIARKFENIHFITNVLLGMTEVYSAIGKYELALPLMQEYYDISKELKDFSFQKTALERLSDLEFKMNNTRKAYLYLMNSKIISDSLNETEITNRLHQLNEQFKSVEKEKQIVDLKYHAERTAWKLQRNQWILIISIFSLAAAIIISILFYRNFKKQKQITDQQKQLHALKLKQLEKDHRLNIFSALLEGEEKERNRLGRDLHDGLGGLLSAIKLKIQNNAPKNQEYNIIKDLDDAIDEMRRVAQSLLPDVLNRHGIEKALMEFSAKMSNDDILIEFQSFNLHEHLIQKEKQLMLFRIAQELINNAYKHSGTSYVLVQLQQRDQVIYLTVEDEGKGFKTQGNFSNHSGIENLKFRVAYLKGKLEIDSIPGKGTSIMVSFHI